MVLSVVVLDNQENFLQFLDPDLCSIEETISKGGLRTIEFEYKFQDPVKDKRLFKFGNKIWVTNDNNLKNCLYVINTDVTEDIYHDNSFSLDAEEALVELNNAPFFNQNMLSKDNFKITKKNGEVAVTVDYNALNAWFGNYLNIGVVQECITDYASQITLSGSMSLMSLLRYIEEETGNIFVTRYEKDVLDNTIHRYLDFLNPINVFKPWQLNVEYDFVKEYISSGIYTANGELTTDTYEDVETEDDFVPETVITPLKDINPEDVSFRVVDEEDVLLEWDAEEVGFDNSNVSVAITLSYDGRTVGLIVNDKSFAIVTDANCTEIEDEGFISVYNDPDVVHDYLLPDDCYFEIYNTKTDSVIFKTCINHQIGTVHEEILDFGFNLDNVTLEWDESECYTAISPVFSLNDNNDSVNSISRTDLSKIIQKWNDLEVQKGTVVVPMILQKTTVTGTENNPCRKLSDAKAILGEFNLSNNYWARPVKPNDQLEDENKSYEFWVATAYWKAPFTKLKDEFHIESDKQSGVEYQSICSRKDNRNTRGPILYPKMGPVETSEEDPYAVYNAVCRKLKEKMYPDFVIKLDVANLRKGKFNDYNLHDKVYVKIPGQQELITARVSKTTKKAHDVASNTIELTNYSVKTVKTNEHETYIDAEDMSIEYPKTRDLNVRLVNTEYDPDDSDTGLQYPANKLLSFTVYKLENNSLNATGAVYAKKTDAYGKVKIPLKYDPGDYEIDINFAGDEEYSEANLTVKVNVHGYKEVIKEVTTNPSKSKTTSTKKTKTVKTYWTKCGVSPDKKTIISIAQPSASKSDWQKRGLSYHTIYSTIFENYCPNCKKRGGLRFDGGKANKCITSAGAHGRGYKIRVPEREVTCIYCDSDYDGVTGLEKSTRHVSRLRTTRKPVKSSKAERAKLTKGKLVFGTKKVVVK